MVFPNLLLTTKKGNGRKWIFLMNPETEVSGKTPENRVHTNIKRLSTMTKSASPLKCRIVQHMSINVINHTNGLKDKNHLDISIDAEKILDKSQHALGFRGALENLGLENTCQYNKSWSEKPTANISLVHQCFSTFLLL